jgi:hypothetical protein
MWEKDRAFAIISAVGTAISVLSDISVTGHISYQRL